MKNALLLLLFILALSSCTIEKRRYFKGYHVALRQAQGPVQKRESEKEGKRESVLEEQCTKSEPNKPQRGDIVMDDNITAIDQSNAGDTTPYSDTQKPQRGDIVIAGDIVTSGDIIITSPEHITTTNSPLPIQNTASVMGHKKSHALEGIGAIFLLGIITLAVVIGLVIFLFSDSAIAGLIGGLIVGLLVAVGIYLLLIFLFVALLLFIIKTFGA